ncbi:MAG: glycerol kinase GlpK [Planctomycetota bacterium]|nr:glycerol kinase GlpK [Planctomycetota bacterium]
MSRVILALDQGTTSSRAILFDVHGRPLEVKQQEFRQILPKPGWVEHDPEDIWSTQLAVAREVLSGPRHGPEDVAAIGVTNQRETTLLWERATGKAVAPAIVWQSRASEPICRRLKESGHEPRFQEKTGLLLDPYFSGTKIRYLLDRDAGLQRQAEKGELLFGTVDSFLIWRLTGGKRHVTDLSNASRTLLLNIHTLEWDQELLDILNIPAAVLPEVVPSSGIVGQTDPELFGRSIPIAGIAGDQQAAMFGQACFHPGDVKNTYGTGCFMLMNTGSSPVVSKNKLLTTIGWQMGDQVTYCLEGSVFIGGAVVQWLRDGLGLIESASEIESLASSVNDAGGLVLVPAFVGLGAPYWDPTARGILLGITRGTTDAHLARAAVESMAFQTRDLLEAMQKDAKAKQIELKVDGGACVNNLLMQFQADILGSPVRRPKITETTARGAAFLAGLGVGFWSQIEEIAELWECDRIFEPQIHETERTQRYRTWQQAVARSQHWHDTNGESQ